MNLVDIYLEMTVFPFHKILNWSFEQRMQREQASIYTMGSPMPRQFVTGARNVIREARIVFGGLTDAEVKRLNTMMYRNEALKDIRLTSDKATLYLQKGYIKSFNPMGFTSSGHVNHFEAIIDCDSIAVSADPPVTGFESNIAIDSEQEEQEEQEQERQEQESRSWREFLNGYLGIGRRDVM